MGPAGLSVNDLRSWVVLYLFTKLAFALIMYWGLGQLKGQYTVERRISEDK